MLLVQQLTFVYCIQVNWIKYNFQLYILLCFEDPPAVKEVTQASDEAQPAAKDEASSDKDVSAANEATQVFA